MTRICGRCLEAKPPEDYATLKNQFCIVCMDASSKKQNPVRYRATRNAWEKTVVVDKVTKRRNQRMKRRYKIGPIRLRAMLVEQGRKCAICSVPITIPEDDDPIEGATKAVVDHSHRDGHVRKLLCSACNVALGLFEDRMGLLKKAYHYLKSDLSTGR